MDSLRRFDVRLTKYIQGWPGSWRPAMAGVSFLGEPLVVLAFGWIGIIAALGRNQPTTQRAFFFGFVAYGVNTILKLLLHRRRPNDLNIAIFGIRSYSFPSGHAFGSVIFYGLFSYLDYIYLKSPLNILITALLWVLIFMIGVSRIYLKAHYPSDVLAGWILGSLLLALIISLVF